MAARKPLQERIAAAERATDDAALLRHKVHPDPDEAWQGMDIEGRRTWITACLESVIVRPAERLGTNRSYPMRISVVNRAAQVLDVRQTADLGLHPQGNRRVKNDECDAAGLVDLLHLGRLTEAWIAPPEIRELREMTRYRHKLSQLRRGSRPRCMRDGQGLSVSQTSLRPSTVRDAVSSQRWDQ